MWNPRPIIFAMLVILLPQPLIADKAVTFRLNSTSGLELFQVAADSVVYHGRPAVRLVDTTAPTSAPPGTEKHAFAILPNSSFDNVIEAEVAGKPGVGASDTARGFVGIAFHVNEDASQFECFYIRPTNGRATDQLRRNRSTQYFSYPDYPWYRLRRENPGVYESYVDLEVGAWTKIRIEVSGEVARLYVNGAPQPALIVNDLKLGAGRGRIALWVGDGTEAYFSKVIVRPRK